MKAKLVKESLYEKVETSKTEVKDTIDSSKEKLYHPMSGYNNSYDYLKIEILFQELVNGKYRADVIETVYHGDERDKGEEYEEDKQETYSHSSPEFDTPEEAKEWVETTDEIDWEYNR